MKTMFSAFVHLVRNMPYYLWFLVRLHNPFYTEKARTKIIGEGRLYREDLEGFTDRELRGLAAYDSDKDPFLPFRKKSSEAKHRDEKLMQWVREEFKRRFPDK